MKLPPTAFLAMMTTCCLSWAAAEEPPSRAPRETAERAPGAEGGESPPVILLTGFEPFGKGRPPNPSWEGAKRLDGVPWRGHRLVARELPVVWGEPLAQLSQWIDELHPVAIFSFGQGGGYALETLADNGRGNHRDNRGERPAESRVVAEGPRRLAATIDAEALVKRLAEHRFQVRISREAGNYLCEECLYSLEHLKAVKKLDATVLFCHVPPLSDRYTAARVEEFIRAMLESWHEVYRAAPAPLPN